MESEFNQSKNLSEANHWIKTSRLQIERFVESLLSAAENTNKEDYQVPAIADAHFLLNSLAQLEKCLKNTEQALPTDRSLQLRCLRDVHEHWEKHKKLLHRKK